MNLCVCGCGNECINKFLRGHNKKNIMSTDKFEDDELILTENYTLLDVPENAIINYEAGKKWLDTNFENYSVRLIYNVENLPSEIVLSACRFIDTIKKDKQFIIGKGDTFSKALKDILRKVN